MRSDVAEPGDRLVDETLIVGRVKDRRPGRSAPAPSHKHSLWGLQGKIPYSVAATDECTTAAASISRAK